MGLRKRLTPLGSWIWIYLLNIDWREGLKFNHDSVGGKYLIYPSWLEGLFSHPWDLFPGLMGGLACWLSCLVLCQLPDHKWLKPMAGVDHLKKFRCPLGRDFGKATVSWLLKPVIWTVSPNVLPSWSQAWSSAWQLFQVPPVIGPYGNVVLSVWKYNYYQLKKINYEMLKPWKRSTD